VASSKASRRAGARRPRGRGGFLLGVALTCILLPLQLAAQTREPSPTELIESLLAGRDPVGGPFQLIDHTGRQRSDTDFRGKLLVIYFGFTSCPDVCPTELQSISLALDALGPAAAAVQPLFISIDPERDTPARLADFVSSFHPQFVGLTGELDVDALLIRAGSRPGDELLRHAGDDLVLVEGVVCGGLRLVPLPHDRDLPSRPRLLLRLHAVDHELVDPSIHRPREVLREDLHRRQCTLHMTLR